MNELNAEIPPPPDLRPHQWQPWVILLGEGKRPSLGWQARSERKGGNCYLVGEDRVVGSVKVLERFPATPDGWNRAWRYLMKLEPGQEAEMRTRLAARAAEHQARVAMAELDARTQVRLRRQVFLGGYAAEVNLTKGEPYDLRFTQEDLIVTVPRGWPPLVSAPYHQIEELEIGGPGLMNNFRVGLRLIAGADGGFVSAPTVFGTTSIQTIIRVQMAESELYFQNSTTQPHLLRVQLARPLAAIRITHAPRADAGATEAATAKSAVAELKDLASMLDAGLLTRDEFDQLKAKLLGG